MFSVIVALEEPAMRKMTREGLAAFDNLDVRIAKNGEDVITLSEVCDGPDLIFLSGGLPVTSGWEVLRVVKDEYNGWEHTKVVFIGESFDCASKAWCIDSTCDYIGLPLTMFDIEEAVVRALEVTSSRN